MPQRHTMQKEIIYSAFLELHNHPTADVVYEYIHPRYPSISRATVYRVLHQLSENGQIRQVDLFDGADCFDHNLTPHCHARCTGCHRIFDVICEKPPLSSFLISEQDDFSVSDYSVELFGLCSDCRMKADHNVAGSKRTSDN